jgi:Family of unknown function (DUF6518)
MSLTEVTDSPSPPASDGAPSPVAGLSVAIAVGLAVGILTAYGQGWLTDATTSLANSAGPWSVAAFLVARYNRRLIAGAVSSLVTLAGCEFGYALATEIRGDANATSTVVFWLTAALLAGPPLGIAGAWSTGRGLRRGVGFGVIGGVLLGEGLYGWTTVADTTDWRYWALEALVGAIVVAVAGVRSRRPPHALAAVAVAALVATVVFAFGRLV